MTGECWACGRTRPVAYTDVLELHWCEECYRDIYLGEREPGERADGSAR